jgi:hypothetical protein
MHARRRDLEELHHVRPGGRASVQCRVMMYEGEELALPGCVGRFHGELRSDPSSESSTAHSNMLHRTHERSSHKTKPTLHVV